MSTIDIRSTDHLLLGARAAGYPGVRPGSFHGLEDHERRIGRRVHLGMTFVRPGDVPLSTATDLRIARRPETSLIVCWKPVRRWAEAHGRRRAVDQYLRSAARFVASTAAPVILVPHHEPENDIGTAGSAEDYRRMFAHVRGIFDDEGATNVEWGVAFMNYPKWDRVLSELWPAGRAPEWCWFNAYGSPSRTDFEENVGRFYTALTEQRWFDPRRAAWGVREWSTKALSVREAARYFDQARHVINEDRFPKIGAYVVFDSTGHENDTGMQISRDAEGNRAPAKEAAYRDFAHESRFGPLVPVRG